MQHLEEINGSTGSAAQTNAWAPLTAAERMRRHRQRRRDELRCLRIELRETEIDELIRKGFLKSETRNNSSAVVEALYAYFDCTLGAMP